MPIAALQTAASGMQLALSRSDADAGTIATRGPDVSAMVDLDVQRSTFAALATTVRASDDMLGTAIDLLA